MKTFPPRFYQLSNLKLLSIEIDVLENNGHFSVECISNRIQSNNLAMCESSLPTLIVKVSNYLLSRDQVGPVRVSLKELGKLDTVEFAEIRIRQLIHDTLYSDMGLESIPWNGNHEFDRVFYFKPSGSDTLKFFNIYERNSLVSLIAAQGYAELTISRVTVSQKVAAHISFVALPTFA
jgi:hypothetical protein